jgi:hypothetical protein
MADGLDLLSAMFAQDYRPIEDPYGIAAQGVASALPYAVNPYGSTAGNFATVLGGALVSGLLGYQARKRNVLQSRALMEALTQGVTPERRQELIEQSPRLAKPLAMLELQSAQRAREQAAAQQKMMQEYKYKSALQKQEDLGIPFTKALAIEEGRPAEGASTAQAATSERPVYFGAKGEERLDKIRGTLQSNQIVKDLEEVQTNIQSLAPAVFDETGLSGVEFVMKAAKSMDPRSTVRGEEFATLEGSAGVKQTMSNYYRKAMGEGGLSLQQRAEIMDLVKREYNARVAQVQKRANAAVDRASRQLGIRKEDAEKVDLLRKDLLAGLSLESGDALINKTAAIPGVKLPGDFDISGKLTEIKNRTLNADQFLANLRSQYGIEQTTQQQQAQPAQPVRESAFYEKAIDKIEKDPTKVGQLNMNERRLKTLMSKGEANWTLQEKAEVVALLKFFGVK